MQRTITIVVGLMLLLTLSAPGAAALFGDELVGGSSLLDAAVGLQPSTGNPARLLAPTNQEFALELPLTASLSAWNISTLQLLGETWTDEQRDRVGAGVGTGGLTAAVQAGPFLGYRYGNYAGRVGVRGIGAATVPKSITDIAFYGIDLVGDTFGDDVTHTFDLSETDGWGAAYLEAAASAAVDMPAAAEVLGVQQVTAGVTVKYLRGLAYVSTDIRGRLEAESVAADTTITVTDLQIGYVESTSGQGFGADLGVSVQVNDRITVDASILNIGRIVWSGVSGESMVLPEDHEGTLLGFSFTRDPFAFAIEFDEDLELEEIAYDGSDIAMTLPLELRLGASYVWNPQVTFAGQIHHTRVTRSQTQRSVSSVSMAAEYRPLEILPLRTSLTVNSRAGVQLNAGFGVHSGPVRFDASLTNVAGLLFDTSGGMGFGMRIGVGF